MCCLSCVVRLFLLSVFFFFKQKTADEMRISDWSSDVCSSDLVLLATGRGGKQDVDVPQGRPFVAAAPLPDPEPWEAAAVNEEQARNNPWLIPPAQRDRESVVSGKSVSVRVVLGGRRLLKTKNTRCTH